MLPVARSSRRAGTSLVSRSCSKGSANGIGRIVAHGPWGMPGRWSTTMFPLPSARADIGVLAGSRSSTVSMLDERPRSLYERWANVACRPSAALSHDSFQLPRNSTRCGVGARRRRPFGWRSTITSKASVAGPSQSVTGTGSGCSVPNTNPR